MGRAWTARELPGQLRGALLWTIHLDDNGEEQAVAVRRIGACRRYGPTATGTLPLGEWVGVRRLNADVESRSVRFALAR
jgi:hypothetical protein